MSEGDPRPSIEKAPILPESKWFSPAEVQAMRYACDRDSKGWIRDSHTLLHAIRNSPKVKKVLEYWEKSDKEVYEQILNEVGFAAGFQVAQSEDFAALITDLDDFLDGYAVPEGEGPSV